MAANPLPGDTDVFFRHRNNAMPASTCAQFGFFSDRYHTAAKMTWRANFQGLETNHSTNTPREQGNTRVFRQFVFVQRESVANFAQLESKLQTIFRLHVARKTYFT
jgi:hypothetical protein